MLNTNTPHIAKQFLTSIFLKFFFLLSILFFFSAEITKSQNYGFFSYNDEQGLTSNLVKTITQDSAGFIWIGTDAGLVLYDGKSFTTISEEIPSSYIKALYNSSNNRLVVASDFGVGYLNRKQHGYQYEPILKGTTTASDTALTYPKSIFEASDGSFWISDINGVIQIKNGIYKKYKFDSTYASDSYFRSFVFVEDEMNNLIVSSWTGSLFRFDRAKDKFIKLQYKATLPNSFINHISLYGTSRILVATNFGIEEVHDSKDFKSITSKLLLSLAEVSTFLKTPEGNYLIGTWNSGLFSWNPKTKLLVRIAEVSSGTINKIFKDRENGIWICSDDGIVLMKKNIFTQAQFRADLSSMGSIYIRNLIADESGNIYFSDQENIYKVIYQNGNIIYELIHRSQGKRVFSFDVQNNNLWVSYRNSELFFKKGNDEKIISPRELGGRITSLNIDKDGNSWGFVELRNRVIRIDKDFKITFYDFPVSSNNSQLLSIDELGEIYFIYSDSTYNLFHYNKSSGKFSEIEISNHEHFKNQVMIFDFKSIGKNEFFVASSRGLCKIKDGEISNLLIAEKKYQHSPIKAVSLDHKKNYWIGTEQDLLFKINNQLVSFSSHDGLKNSVVSANGIAIDKFNRIWVATSNGLFYLQEKENRINKTPTPTLLGMRVNDDQIYISDFATEFVGKVNLEIIFASLTYPNKINYQIRLVGLMDDWVDYNSDNKSEFYNLPPGEYIFQVRAQQSGNFWSEIQEISFSILAPWYFRWWAVTLYAIILIVGFYFLIQQLLERRLNRLRREKEKLELLVAEKTIDLKNEKEYAENLLRETQFSKIEIERTNEDLQKVNEFKSNLLAIAAHDLKNPLTGILGYSEMLQDESLSASERKQFASVILKSSLNMLHIVTEILDSAIIESTKFQLAKTNLNLKELVEKIIFINQTKASLKKQKIIFKYDSEIWIEADLKWIRAAIDNLISNAVKYSPLEKEIIVELKIEEKFALIICKDSGPGFTLNDKSKLFGKFQRLSAQPTGGESSTGLGLSIAHEIVGLHKGKIKVESEPGEGTTFTVFLPIGEGKIEPSK